MIRSLKGTDFSFYNGEIMMSLVLKFGNPKDVPPIAEMLSKKVLGLHLGTDGQVLYLNPKRIPIYDLPQIENNEELSHYMFEYHTRPYETSLGSIGVNDNSIVINVNHMLADGGYFKFIINEISKGNCSELKDYYPKSAETVFNKQIGEAKFDFYPTNSDMRLTNFISKDFDELRKTKFAQYIYSNFPASSFKCYNEKTKAIHGLTESIFINFYASVVAYNNESYKCGIGTCIDLRKYSNSNTWNDNSIFTLIPIIPQVLPTDTYQEIGEKMRNDLNQGIKEGRHFSYLKALYERRKGPDFEGSRLFLSNIGPVPFGGPLLDVYMGYSELSSAMPNILSITSSSYIGNNKNNIAFRLKYNSDKMSTREADMISKSTIWGMQNIDFNLPLEKAISELQQFQRSYLKQKKGTIRQYL